MAMDVEPRPDDAPATPPSELPAAWRPASVSRRSATLPTGRVSKLKDLLLGPALHNEALAHERLGRPTALAVFSSDALSSTAYATEEMLRTLLFAGVGVAAFGFIVPITIAMVAVLAILLFSYRQTIKAYPSAGGAYIVTKDNLGVLPAQVAGVALLTDYVLTVAVSVSAGTAALYSAVPAAYAWRVPIALGFIVLVAWGNLRGVKESGRLFALPTFGFIVSVLAIIVIGIVKALTGHLHRVPAADPALLSITRSAGFFLILHAFASGGAAVTGVEAISNGVPAFKPPEWKNARSTLMVMGGLLGGMFLGLSWLAHRLHTVPTDQKTVISQIAKGVLGSGPQFFFVQLMTLLILVLAANTSFADFPRLASFAAEDAFMPRQLTKRGHRLVFSNGIMFLAASAAVLVVIFGADVTHLIPLYAIGVFTSFTLSQSGMAVRHIKRKESGWRLGLVINGGGAVVTGVVTIIIAITKFTHGAWAVMLFVPILVGALVRLNHQYESEAEQLSEGVTDTVKLPVPVRHVSIVMIDKLDNAAARALRMARTLRTDRTEALHVVIDHNHSGTLAEDWAALRPEHIDLRLLDSPDRKLVRRALDYVNELIADGETQVSVLIPQLHHNRLWHKLLHDRTSERLADQLTRLPNVNVTYVPFRLGHHATTVTPATSEPDPAAVTSPPVHDGIAGVVWRRPAHVEGTVEQLAIQTSSGTPSLVAVVNDGTGTIDLLFLGRTAIGGIALGARLSADGTAINHRGRMTIMNPRYELLAAAPTH
jgi:amino acid transporter